ncbi:sigma-70 family RNA polymerase sigma factor [Roseitranquillus sediminis]|uniref:sigma-70 family RNA polymerase sigma factor n=1 Tax=Roseitranquillus sediminis TaxID=2809051 RepID=UPI001D0C791E|nr:sigma-70 family RNA polymerase sigma factor [Roseitranquillus sediminis]MBM9595970.1 sigma-70 family RNA polymerase sigma factor [Roseitranquillus sediminis]
MPSQGSHPSEALLAEDARLAGLLRRGRDGDRVAYHAFLTDLSVRLRRQMCASARGLGGADVEDLVQEILLSVHASRVTWDASRPVLPWIAAIARYRLADALRRRGRAGRLFDEMALLLETFDMSAANSTSEELVNSMSMIRAMDELSATERRAFTLVRLRGHSSAEAARLSGSTVAAVKVAVHRAARKLQALVAQGRL